MKKYLNNLPEKFNTVISDFITKLETNTEVQWEQIKNVTRGNDLESTIGDLSIPVADIALIPIQLIPIGGNDQLSIGALLQRDKPMIRIRYKAASEPANHLVRLEKDALIGCDSENVLHQLQDILPEFKYEMVSEEPGSKYDGVVLLDNEQDNKIDLSAFDSYFDFNPRELIPPAGENVIAAVCLKSFSEIREILLDLNESRVSRASNIERRIQKKMAEHEIHSAHVYCEIDLQEYYHIYLSAFIPGSGYRKTRLSTSVSTGADEDIVNQFFAEEKNLSESH
jgi:porphobilinogen deaminase